MYLADGGGGGTTTPTPQFTGTQTLHVEPSAIPDALKAFTSAYDRVTRKIQDLESLPIRDWAADPVSSETALEFQQRSNTGGADSAITCLKGYQAQLKAAIDSLEGAHEQYVLVEGDNATQWGQYHQD
ncbi:hypothetical protein [Actinophytocola oryzae]|uniref:PE family protein n=1 Tax=Actinophytocola oryzae TaxID=502181 RepID=A0A4R7UVM8_9PSEU|nr:hypothetical protein [Actinophytocola oryzae]TDV40002.1 hypothetical protein CLV71_12419 [Actinophytocola oryzae]